MTRYENIRKDKNGNPLKKKNGEFYINTTHYTPMKLSPTKEQQDNIIHMIDNGVTKKFISKKLKLSPYMINKILRMEL